MPDTETALWATTAFCGVVILVGIVGIILPVLPGTLLVLGSVLIWALVAQNTVGWVVLAIAVALAGTGWLLQYLIPGRRMRDAGVPTRTLVIGGVVGLVGFFVIPVAGLPIGFVAGVYMAELARLKSSNQAWPSTVHAIRAAILSYGIELSAAFLIAGAWVVGAWRVLT